jgi:hypothetical protein
MGAGIPEVTMDMVLSTWGIIICGALSALPGWGGAEDNPAIPTNRTRKTRKSFFTSLLLPK